MTLEWSKATLNLACGSYSVVVDPAFGNLLTIQGQFISAQAPANASVGTINPVFTLSRDSNQTQAATTSITLTIKIPKMTSLQLESKASIKETYTIGQKEKSIAFPAYSCLPLGCVKDLDYTVQLISKKPDARFEQNSNFNRQIN
jgi:hypothetical protein